MKKTTIILALAAWMASGAVASALDMVRLHKGTPVNGRITKVSPTEVEIEGQGSALRTIPVNEIDMIAWDEEPSLIKTARQNIREANYQSALDSLSKITLPANARAEIRQDLEFYTAYAKAQQAMGGLGDIKTVGREVNAFITTHRGSYHWLAANELLGDMLVADQNFEQAVRFYGIVAQAPWADYKMRAGVLLGRALLAQNKTQEAQQQFDAVIANPAQDELAALQKLSATLGKARCMAAEKKPDEAIKTIDGIIVRADPEQSDLLAQSYNALGSAYRASNKNKEALMAFLHVDLIYHANPESHAEALFNLVQLWEADNKPERASRCRQLLDQRYRNSRWNKQLAGA